MSICVLPPDVAAKIAAGEVVNRPVSVVKELVENAIDAGAKTIRVEIQNGGKRLIRVMDDGCGIPSAEISLAFARHATSKLRQVEDLESITTLGFRGEALASVAAVSQLTLVSRPVDQPLASRIRIEGGQQRAVEMSGSPAGTIITVENLFFNVPARLKFLKAEATEVGHIQHIVANYALAHPHIRFSLVSENRTVLQTNGGDAFDALAAVLGLETARQMLPVIGNEDIDGIAIGVTGFAGPPALHRAGRDQITLFLNRRSIQDRALAQAVVQAYHTFLPVGRFPVAVINITLDPAEADVNVHPTKAEVNFVHPGAVFKAVQKAVRSAVIETAPIPGLGGGQPISRATVFGGHAGDTAPWQTPLDRRPPSSSLDSGFAIEAQRTLPQEEASESEPPPPVSDVLPPQVPVPPALPQSQTAIWPSEPAKLPPLRVVGQVQQMYIITEGPDGLYLIDQHAAHERILYEKLAAQKAQAAVVGQQLMESVMVELSPGQSTLLGAEGDALADVGFGLEPFGGHTWRIRAVPEMLGQSDPAQALVDILTEMADGAVPLARETHEKIAIIVCKRASIKGGQVLSMEEMRQLIRQLESCEFPKTCPHGRPTMIHLSTSQLAREFCRS